jgi:hypothetical protein
MDTYLMHLFASEFRLHPNRNGQRLHAISSELDLPFPFREQGRFSEIGRLLANLVEFFEGDIQLLLKFA